MRWQRRQISINANESCTVSISGNKLLLKNAEGIEIGTRTLNNDELKRIGQTIEEGNYSNLTDLVSAKEAEVYLHFLESGSTVGMTEAELRAVRRIEELIQSNKIDYNGILRIRNETVKSDVEVVRKTTEDSVEDVGRVVVKLQLLQYSMVNILKK